MAGDANNNIVEPLYEGKETFLTILEMFTRKPQTRSEDNAE